MSKNKLIYVTSGVFPCREISQVGPVQVLPPTNNSSILIARGNLIQSQLSHAVGHFDSRSRPGKRLKLSLHLPVSSIIVVSLYITSFIFSMLISRCLGGILCYMFIFYCVRFIYVVTLFYDMY